MPVPSLKWIAAVIVVAVLLIFGGLESCIFVTVGGSPFNRMYASCPYCPGRGNWDEHHRYYRCTSCTKTFEVEQQSSPESTSAARPAP
jgi:DNA-directed RNA polymerase subunit RPC12/RpoP